jgi:hypothetical protein
MAKWEEQWKRVLRWYERFRLIDGGAEQTNPIESYEDDVLAFFMNCYHFKDWLKNDPATGVKSPEVEAFVNRSPNLTLCGGLATGSKHLSISDPRFDPDTKISKRITSFAPTVTVGPPGTPVEAPPTRIAVIYGIKASGVTHDAFIVATRCVEEWDAFLVSKGLL